MNKRKTTKGISIPRAQAVETAKPLLPYARKITADNHVVFDFSQFDRSHELFNLGCSKKAEEAVGGAWFLDLLDCLKITNGMTTTELQQSTTHQLHRIDWSTANAKMPEKFAQAEFWQFRISRAKGRIIGPLIDGVFYIMWLDPHHNLTDSPGYENAVRYNAALSEYEKQEQRIRFLEDALDYNRKELATANELLNEAMKSAQ